MKLETAFLDTWESLDDEVAAAIVVAMRQWHPPFDWSNPERGEV
jgi:hypothetical protein